MTPGKWGRWWWRAHYRPICTGLIRWGVILLLVGLFFAFKLHYPSELIVAPTPSISRSAVVGLAIAAAANPLVLLILGWWSVIIGQSVLTHHMDREERVRGLRFSRWLTPWLWSIGGGCLIGIGVAMGVMAWAGQGTPSSSGPALSLLMLAGIEAVMLSLWVWTLGIMAFWVTRSALGGIGTVGGVDCRRDAGASAHRVDSRRCVVDVVNRHIKAGAHPVRGDGKSLCAELSTPEMVLGMGDSNNVGTCLVGIVGGFPLFWPPLRRPGGTSVAVMRCRVYW
ncbi:MAG: hypothetical protein C7B43_20950 [Sulfobacillus benefaciens]|uniref:Uncharacterized protein n=1 Tax=Sulfobacillus benefaciens TaxID=453960 RepID=A0A2T2WIQ6_9FIRM|nr:MAG: hypothetical protein C7B43_20950 [Sulfobacillus benefaciens]